MKQTIIITALALSAVAGLAQDKAAAKPAHATPAPAQANAASDADPIIVTAGPTTIRKSEFEEAAFKAKPGDVTDIVKTPFGFHIIKVDGHESTPFEQVKATLERTARQKKVQEMLDAMKEGAKPTYDEAYFAPPAPPAPPAAAASDGVANKPAGEKASAAKPSTSNPSVKKP